MSNRNVLSQYGLGVGAGSQKMITCSYGLKGCRQNDNCQSDSKIWCIGGTINCENDSVSFCEQRPIIITHTCDNGPNFQCEEGSEGCEDNSTKYCNTGRKVMKHCQDGTHFECEEGSEGCSHNSPKYCGGTPVNKPITRSSPGKQIPQKHYMCEDGSDFYCWDNEPNCYENSAEFCAGGDSWCESVGGRGNPICKFDNWDSCVENTGCVTDPKEAHPGWYDLMKSENWLDRARVELNHGGAIVDECNQHNTDWFSNPRCRITSGKYEGEVGVCRYDGVNVKKCAPVGQRCSKAVPSYCKKEQELLLGHKRDVNPMCFKTMDGDVYLNCV
jgi:hypothetical protein